MNSNKRIGIFTLHRALNYGAVWQCWALKNACESFGYEVETIDYNPFGDYQKKWFIKKRPTIAYKYLTWLRQFNHFVGERLNPTQHTVSHEWIKNNPPADDVYVVGSDTVWANSVAGDYLDSYLLDFAPDYVKRISYAASTGGNPMELNEYQLSELRKFSAISIRERQSVSDVQSKVDVPVADVCDPTILLKQEEYEAIEKKPLWLPKHYIVYFDLAGDYFGAEAAKVLSKELNLPVVNVGGRYMRWAKRNYLAPTPEQWLYIIHYADYVCTNSFHGVAYSIIYRRPFVCCAAQLGGRAKTNGRVQNLLEQTNLIDRYITSIEQVEAKVNSDMKFDDEAIGTYRNRSLQWLKNAIENETNKER
ncbi:MAG: polysaccharide pyruvyl transferase family protein [Paludibacteraceae bacterium]|nr:polysaccharide pyruvyl transferase family protein [Paludibacteraceae bacterium]